MNKNQTKNAAPDVGCETATLALQVQCSTVQLTFYRVVMYIKL